MWDHEDQKSIFEKFKGKLDAEDQFEDLMRDYDWYYEMSDDPRIYNRGQEVDQKLKSLVKTLENFKHIISLLYLFHVFPENRG